MKNLKVTIKIEGLDKELNLNLAKEDLKVFLQIVGVFDRDK